MANVFQQPHHHENRDPAVEAAVELVQKGISSPADIMRLVSAMKKTDPKAVFTEVCNRSGANADEVLQKARQLAGMLGIRF